MRVFEALGLPAGLKPGVCEFFESDCGTVLVTVKRSDAQYDWVVKAHGIPVARGNNKTHTGARFESAHYGRVWL